MAGAQHGMCELMARHGRGTAWARHGHGMGTAWARHGHGMLCVNRPLGSSGIKLPDPHNTCRTVGPPRPGSSPLIHRRRWSYRCLTRPTYSRLPPLRKRPAALHPALCGATAHWPLLKNTLYQCCIDRKLFLIDIWHCIFKSGTLNSLALSPH